MRSILALSLLVVPAALVAEDKKPDADLTAIAGKWTIEKAELGGKDLTETLKAGKLEIAADGKYTFDNGAPQKDIGTLVINSGKNPKEIDIKGSEGPNKGKTIKTIYKFDKDTVTVCYQLGDGDRPTKFETKPDTRLLLVTYKRAK
jgi:uncharacterized protein (TIGR03067 family)